MPPEETCERALPESWWDEHGAANTRGAAESVAEPEAVSSERLTADILDRSAERAFVVARWSGPVSFALCCARQAGRYYHLSEPLTQRPERTEAARRDPQRLFLCLEDAMDARPLRDIRWACARLGVGRDSVYAWVRLGRIPNCRIGRRILFDEGAIDAFIARGGEPQTGPRSKDSDQGSREASG
jgi:excisionase family DNA binding protein